MNQENETQSQVLVISGSARSESNTLIAVRELIPFPSYDLIDLSSKTIKYFAYDRTELIQDDFHSIAQEMLKYDTLVFATPVYWYTMSGQMKVFIDRLTELMYEYKAIGKALKGKKTYLIVCGGGAAMPEGFEVPFKSTSEYFEMQFVRGYYHQLSSSAN